MNRLLAVASVWALIYVVFVWFRITWSPHSVSGLMHIVINISVVLAGVNAWYHVESAIRKDDDK